MPRHIGLTSGFARLVMFLGHGSFCLNNPHKSAYDCGALLGGRRRAECPALAIMLNDPRVRQILAGRGLEVPAETLFLGGLHNTCNDSVTFYDLDLLPKSHVADFETSREILEMVCERNAHAALLVFRLRASGIFVRGGATARRGPLRGFGADAARVRQRDECHVLRGPAGPRGGLYLDRRSFLVSYDPTQDDQDRAILAHPGGRGAGLRGDQSSILLFLHRFARMGSGTKLPHNVTSLLGVMDWRGERSAFGVALAGG